MTDAELDKYRDDVAIMRMAASMKERGIEFEIKESTDPDTGELRRAVLVTKIPEIEKKAMEFFTDKGLPLPGADKLKERFNKELDALNKRSDTGTCLPCQKGALVREYLPMVRKLIEANDKLREAATNEAIELIKAKSEEHQYTTIKEEGNNKDVVHDTNTGVVELSGSNEEGRVGAKTSESVLRRAKHYLEKVFSFGKRKTEEG